MLMRLSSSMNSLVDNKTCFVSEGLPTFTAHGVDFLVINKCSLAHEGFLTFVTLIGSFSSVGSLGLIKFNFAIESFPIFSALVMPSCHVC